MTKYKALILNILKIIFLVLKIIFLAYYLGQYWFTLSAIGNNFRLKDRHLYNSDDEESDILELFHDDAKIDAFILNP